MKKSDETNPDDAEVWPPPVPPPFRKLTFDSGIAATEYPDALEVYCSPNRPSGAVFGRYLMAYAVFAVSAAAWHFIRAPQTARQVKVIPGSNGTMYIVTVRVFDWSDLIFTALILAGGLLIVSSLRSGLRTAWSPYRFRFEREGRLLRNGWSVFHLGPYIYAETKDGRHDVVLDDPAGKAEKRIRGFTSREKAEHAARYIQAYLAGVRLHGEED